MHVQYKNVSKTRNVGLKHAKGKYIAFLDADDTWLPDRVLRHTTIMEANDNIGAVFSDAYKFNDKNEKWMTNQLRDVEGYIDAKDALERLLNWSFIYPSAITVKKSFIDKVGNFDEQYTHCEDHYLWMQIALEGCNFYYLKQPLSLYRQHEGVFDI